MPEPMVQAADMGMCDAAAIEPGTAMGKPDAHAAEIEIAADSGGRVPQAAAHVAEAGDMSDVARMAETAAETADMAETTEATHMAEPAADMSPADVAAAKAAAAVTTTAAAARPDHSRRNNGAERDRRDRRQDHIPFH